MEQASALLDFFVRSTINFIKAMTLEGQKPIDAVGKTKARMLSLLREKFQGEVKRKRLREYIKVGKQLFDKALDELVESGKVQLVERDVRGQKCVFVTLTKFSTPFSSSPRNNHNRNSTETQPPEKLGKKGVETLSSPSTPFDINTTETQPQPQKGERVWKKKGVETTFPEPINPEPMPAPPEPEPPQPMPEPEPIQTMPAVNPEKTEANHMPAPEEHVQKIVRIVLNYLEDFWSCKKIPGEPFRRFVAKISGRYENAVWELLFPAYVVKLHTTDFFILRDDKHRPKGYEGLIDDEGVLPIDEPALF
jgi:hypothetical protein